MTTDEIASRVIETKGFNAGDTVSFGAGGVSARNPHSRSMIRNGGRAPFAAVSA